MKATVKAMAAEDITYKGVLYGGLMLTDEGPKVLEFNVRFGDPETQAVLPRLASDLAPALLATIEGTVAELEMQWSPEYCVCVVIASGGYPGSYQTGVPITGLSRRRGCGRTDLPCGDRAGRWQSGNRRREGPERGGVGQGFRGGQGTCLPVGGDDQL